MSETVSWDVPDISCQHCAMAIKRALSSVSGVSQIVVDVTRKTLSFVSADAGTVTRARAILQEIGYPPAST